MEISKLIFILLSVTTKLWSFEPPKDSQISKVDKASEFIRYRKCFKALREGNTADEAETGFFEGPWGGYIAFTSVQDKQEGIIVITDDTKKDGEVDHYFAPFPRPIENYFKNKSAPIAYLEVNYGDNRSLFVHYSREQKGIVRADNFPVAYSSYHTGFKGYPADRRWSSLFLMRKAKRMITNVARMYRLTVIDNAHGLVKTNLDLELKKKLEALKICEEIPDKGVREAIEEERQRFQSFDEYNAFMKSEAELEAEKKACKKNCGKKGVIQK